MPQIRTDNMITDFARDGLLRLEGLLPAAKVRPVREVVLAALAAKDLWREGGDNPRPPWPERGVKPARDIGHRRPEVAALFAEPALLEVIDGLLGGRPFDRTLHRRPQILCSLPNGGAWALPSGWHVDLPRLASGESPGIQVFTFLDHVEPQGGGTLVVAGSHRLLNDRGPLKVREIGPLLRRHDFFHGLFAEYGGDGLPRGGVGDVPLRVMELTGKPGDVWVTDLRVLHTAAPNTSSRPRLMVTDRFSRADLMPEIEAAFGWGEHVDKQRWRHVSKRTG